MKLLRREQLKSLSNLGKKLKRLKEKLFKLPLDKQLEKLIKNGQNKYKENRGYRQRRGSVISICKTDRIRKKMNINLSALS